MCVYLREGVCVWLAWSGLSLLHCALRHVYASWRAAGSPPAGFVMTYKRTVCRCHVTCVSAALNAARVSRLPPGEKDLEKERWTDGLGFKQDTFSAHGGIIVNSVIMEYLNTLWGTALNMSSGVWDASWIILIKTNSQSNYLYADHISVAVHFI